MVKIKKDMRLTFVLSVLYCTFEKQTEDKNYASKDALKDASLFHDDVDDDDEEEVVPAPVVLC